MKKIEGQMAEVMKKIISNDNSVVEMREKNITFL